MMIRRILARTPNSLLSTQTVARSHGTAAIARHVNDQITDKTTAPKNHVFPKPSSTVHHSETHDFSSVALKRDDGDYYFEAHSEALMSALNSYPEQQRREQREVVVEPIVQPRVTAKATDMDLIQASHAVHDNESYDKILILMRHGEARHNVFERKWVQQHGGNIEDANLEEDYPVDPLLTGKGCGQMQSLSRRTATFFNNETGLRPDLFVVSPLRRAIQSAIIAFPTHTALSSLHGTEWICHPLCMELVNGNKSEFVSSSQDLEEIFPGVDFSLFEENLGIDGNVEEVNRKKRVPLFESKIDLMGRTDEFLRWIKERDERVIVVSSHATWLHSLCAFSLSHEPESKGLQMFKKGEMRSVGIKFD